MGTPGLPQTFLPKTESIVVDFPCKISATMDTVKQITATMDLVKKISSQVDCDH